MRGLIVSSDHAPVLDCRHCFRRSTVLLLKPHNTPTERHATPLLVERFERTEGFMSDRGLARELEARNLLAERIATVLRQRQEIGAMRRAHESENQRINNDRGLARYYRLSGAMVVQRVGRMAGHPDSGPQAGGDVDATKVAERAVQKYVAHFRWNSVNGSRV